MEKLRLHTEQRVVTTVEDSALRVEMSQEEDDSRRVLWYKPRVLGVIRSHRRDESWSDGL